jgi:hypothetical protein
MIASAPSLIVLVLKPFPSVVVTTSQWLFSNGQEKKWGIHRIYYIVQLMNLCTYRRIQSSDNVEYTLDSYRLHHLESMIKKAHKYSINIMQPVSHSAITQYIYVWYLVSLRNTLQKNISFYLFSHRLRHFAPTPCRPNRKMKKKIKHEIHQKWW